MNNKNKKMIKFQRKEMLVSNAVVEPEPQIQKQSLKQPQQHPSLQQVNYPSVTPPVADKLEIPRQMKIQKITQNIKNRFAAMMDDRPLIKADTLFENEVVCQITGNMAKNNRESFGKDKRKQDEYGQSQFYEKQRIDNFVVKESRPRQEETILQNISQQNYTVPNYLDLISQGIPFQAMTMEQPFQSDSKQLEWNLMEKYKKASYLPSSNYREANNRKKFDILPFE